MPTGPAAPVGTVTPARTAVRVVTVTPAGPAIPLGR